MIENLKMFMLSIVITFAGMSAMSEAVQADEKTKLLYITHFPGRYHDYKFQAKHFESYVKSANEKGAGLDLTINSGKVDESIAFMKKPDFAKGYDIVVYNMCHAKMEDLDLVHNIKQQSEKHKVPAVFIHCAMHCFWPTSPAKNKKLDDLKAKWKKDNPDKPFPSWWQFLGLHTVRHDKKRAIATKIGDKTHPISKGLKVDWVTPIDELYANIDVASDITPILTAVSPQGHPMGKRHPHILAWTRQTGGKKDGARMFSTTLGHGNVTWEDDEFGNLLIRGILWSVNKLK